MRMWMVPPRGLCRKHLLGEHVELHMLLGSLRRGRNLAGFFAKNLLEPASLAARHDALALEMGQRGYVHASPVDAKEAAALLGRLPPDQRSARVDPVRSLEELHRRCPACAALAS